MHKKFYAYEWVYKIYRGSYPKTDKKKFWETVFNNLSHKCWEVSIRIQLTQAIVIFRLLHHWSEVDLWMRAHLRVVKFGVDFQWRWSLSCYFFVFTFPSFFSQPSINRSVLLFTDKHDWGRMNAFWWICKDKWLCTHLRVRLATVQMRHFFYGLYKWVFFDKMNCIYNLNHISIVKWIRFWL